MCVSLSFLLSFSLRSLLPLGLSSLSLPLFIGASPPPYPQRRLGRRLLCAHGAVSLQRHQAQAHHPLQLS
jgi:hypothetical protein